tara:strand:- start:86 stop:496 length:411 start_codon:yes stop_codon:yes gene_type:complete
MNWFEVLKKTMNALEFIEYFQEKLGGKPSYPSTAMLRIPENKLTRPIVYRLDYPNGYIKVTMGKKGEKHVNVNGAVVANVFNLKDAVEEVEEAVGSDTFEKEAGGVSFGGHGVNPELFNIKYGGGKGGKKRKEEDE